MHHTNVADEWGALCASSLAPKSIAHKLLINYSGESVPQGMKGGDPEDTRIVQY